MQSSDCTRNSSGGSTQTVLPSADTAAMLFWALLASGQINMRKVDGWQTLATKPINQPIDLAA
jgi:putative transposase